MLERGEGYLASTASAAGLLAQLGALGYTVTKHGAVAVAEWLSITYGDRGIRVSCLCPQYVRTPMVTDGELPLDKLEPVATILEPEQVADVVVEGIREERLPDPPPPRGRDVHGPPRRRPRSLAPRDAPVAGLSSGVISSLTGN